jgi:hypothetical protein
MKSLNHKIDGVSADAIAVTSHGCLPQCFAVAYIVQSDTFKFVPVHMMAYGVASHRFHLSTSVSVLAYRHLGQQF